MMCRCVLEEKVIYILGSLEMEYKLIMALQGVLVESGLAEPAIRKIAPASLLVYLDLGEAKVPLGVEAWELKPDHQASVAVAGRLTRRMYQLLQVIDQAGDEEIHDLRRILYR